MTRSVALVLLSLATVALADTPGKVQSDPAKACSNASFKPHELCFEIPNDEVARAEFLSEPFYAVLLRTAEKCTIPESERLQTQQLFPRFKVFSMRFYCDENIEENISYTNVNDQFGFLAVYAGQSMKEAKALLEKVRATGKFQDANIRKMQARFVFP